VNRAMLTGLALDVWHQVLDNRVFRAIAVLAALVVLLTFAIGIREDGIVLAWHFYSFEQLGWSDLARMAASQDADVRRLLVEVVQRFLVDELVGTLGVLICLLAAAFFVPRMLEPGAVDTLFSKPVGRTVLLLARFAAGLLMVGLLSAFLILGMHLGFSVRSGHSDPNFLWSLPVLLYRFGLLFSVTVFFGVVTRSAMASLLLTMVFAGFNGCVHAVWGFSEQERHVEAEKRGIPPAEVSFKEGTPAIVRFGLTGVEVAHLVLPKPGDAPELLELIREGPLEQRVARPLFPAAPAARQPSTLAMRWGGPWRQNAWVSLGTSLAFALAVLLLASWRLGRLRF
jgi:hypothetical protein